MKRRSIDAVLGRYSAILVALLLLAVVEPAVSTDDQVPWTVNVATALVLIASLRALWTSRLLLRVVGVLGGLFFALEAAETELPGWASPPLTDAFGMAFIGTVAVGILLDIFAREEPTADTVFGASAVYLLLGLFFARAFALVILFQPDAFAVSEPLAGELAHSGWRSSGLLTYFSLVTLTTVGYGDVSAVTPIARNLAAVEAVIAQLYIAAVVARMVGLYATHRSRRH